MPEFYPRTKSLTQGYLLEYPTYLSHQLFPLTRTPVHLGSNSLLIQLPSCYYNPTILQQRTFYQVCKTRVYKVICVHVIFFKFFYLFVCHKEDNSHKQKEVIIYAH